MGALHALSVEQKSSTDTAILQVYEDFGDVRYEGDKYLAFTKWWRGKVSDTETQRHVVNICLLKPLPLTK